VSNPNGAQSDRWVRAIRANPGGRPASQPGAAPRRNREAGALVVGEPGQAAGRRPYGLLALAILVALAARAVWQTFLNPRATAEVGRSAPDVTVLDVQGHPWRLADLRGRPVFLNFWATWCEPCREEMPLIQKAYADGWGADVQFMGVDVTSEEARPQTVRTYVRRHGYGYPIFLDPRGSAAAAYGVTGLPTSFFVDRSGVIRAKVVGPLDEATLRSDLAALLRHGGGRGPSGP
jgi:cytochrome c biogenesis protein CcmG/thiol:disulfide interchange protein DsbE